MNRLIKLAALSGCLIGAALVIDSGLEVAADNSIESAFSNSYLAAIEKYGDPTVSMANGGLMIRGDSPPSGLALKYNLDETKDFRLKIYGKALKGNSTLRIERASGKYEYLPSPEGSSEYLLNGVSDFNLLFYGDDPFVYELSQIELEECAECSSLSFSLTDDTEGKIREIAGSEYLSEIELFNGPALSFANSSALLDIRSPPSGIYLKYSLDRSQVYRLGVMGSPISGSTKMRVGGDEEAPLYASAPDGQAWLIVENKKDLEILFYSDEASKYQIEKVDIAECPDCRTDSDLREYLLSRIEGLKDALERDRMTAARMLLDWAANNSDYALSSEIASSTTLRLSAMTAAQIYHEMFQANKGAVYCAGFSVFYDKLLKLFDYDSFTMNFGDRREDLTHVTVLVPFEVDGDLRWYVFDPTFNLVFKRDGELLSFSQLIELAREDRVDEITLDEGGTLQRDYIALEEEVRYCGEVKERVEEWVVCTRPEFDSSYYFDQWNSVYLANGYSPGLEGLLELMTKRVFHIGTSLDPETSEKFEQRLSELKIPLGMSE